MKDVGFLRHPSENPNVDTEYGDLTGSPVRTLLRARPLVTGTDTVYLVTTAAWPQRATEQPRWSWGGR